MQLVAYGAQDIYLTGNPQITFFKVVYRRHTNFSMEAIEQTWNGSTTGSSGRCTATISRNGDLVHRMYLAVQGTDVRITQDCDNPGAFLIEDVELEIGGQKIDKQSGLWMECWSELTEPNPSGSVALIEGSTTAGVMGGTLFQQMSLMGGVVHESGQSYAADVGHVHIPLQFWFCRNPGLALPLIALQYHEVKVILNHRLTQAFGGSSGNGALHLWGDYIYLDTDERRRFAQVSHEYLIEQIQEQTISADNQGLNFNHPVKELVFTTTAKGVKNGSSTPLTETALQLKLNGHDRFTARDFRYFTRTQVWQHHTGSGGLDHATTAAAAAAPLSGRFDDSIGVYSFALKPEEHQPSGTCNFSRIDNAVLSGRTVITQIFAVNYNVLRIMSGMGGLAYSN